MNLSTAGSQPGPEESVADESSDENANGQFDHGADTAWLVAEALVQTDSYLIDFSRL